MLQPSSWLYSATGPRSLPADERRVRRRSVRPSKRFQPKLMPPSAALDVVDLLPGVLADVADPEVAVGAVEREAPRVAQAVAPRSRARQPAWPTNGLSVGMPYGLPAACAC